MATCATKHALAIVNGLPFALDDLDEAIELVGDLVGYELSCEVEMNRALELCREGFARVHPWMLNAVFPSGWEDRPGAPSAWVDHYERRHGAELERPVLDKSRFEPCEHEGQSWGVMVTLPTGQTVPLDSVPEPFQSQIREQLGMDDDD